jgi:hypothetical protein
MAILVVLRRGDSALVVAGRYFALGMAQGAEQEAEWYDGDLNAMQLWL